MSLDESLDIGLDTRTPVDDSYKLPFLFTGTINKLTYNVKPEQLTAADREVISGRSRRPTIEPKDAALLFVAGRNQGTSDKSRLHRCSGGTGGIADQPDRHLLVIPPP